MTAVKVVLERSTTGQEVELGPFSQGVVIEDDVVIDVAMSKIIARRLSSGAWMSYVDPLNSISRRLYVQACS